MQEEEAISQSEGLGDLQVTEPEKGGWSKIHTKVVYKF